MPSLRYVNICKFVRTVNAYPVSITLHYQTQNYSRPFYRTKYNIKLYYYLSTILIICIFIPYADLHCTYWILDTVYGSRQSVLQHDHWPTDWAQYDGADGPHGSAEHCPNFLQPGLPLPCLPNSILLIFSVFCDPPGPTFVLVKIIFYFPCPTGSCPSH